VKTQIMPNIRRIVDALDLTLVSSEGDLIHQFVDCIMMGANTKAVLAPADTGGVLENFMYSRNVNGSSREFELPCPGTLVSDQENRPGAIPFHQKTCGSETRIAVMAYVTREILDKDNGGLHTLIAQLITDKVESITNAFANVHDYGCLRKANGLLWYNAGARAPSFGHELNNTILRNVLGAADAAVVTITPVQWMNTCIANLRQDDFIKVGNVYFLQQLDSSWKFCCTVPGKCAPGETTFESNLPELDTTVSIASIVAAITTSLKSIEIDTITKRSVCVCVFLLPSNSCRLIYAFCIPFRRQLITKCTKYWMLVRLSTSLELIHEFQSACLFQSRVPVCQLDVDCIQQLCHVCEKHAVHSRVSIQRYHRRRANIACKHLRVHVMCLVFSLHAQNRMFLAHQL